MSNSGEREKLMDTLYKKAVGYLSEEVVEEYGGESAELIRRKVTTKPVPPDVAALKTYLELMKTDNEFAAMSDSELEMERIRLIQSLK